jgi:serine protease Do
MARWSIPFITLVSGGLVGVFVAGPLLQGQPAIPPVAPRDVVSFRDIAKKVLPAVVSIEARAKVSPKKTGDKRKPKVDDERIPEELRRYFDDFQGPGGADDNPNLGFGSGFLIDSKGVILTNNHVVDGAESVDVVLTDGRKFSSKDIKADVKTDLAIVRIESKIPLPYLELGDSDQMEIGDRVLAAGAPFGLTGSVTSGIISAKGRSLRMNMYEDFLQTDAAINPGNSGGPLINLEGKVIGINSAIKSRNGGFQGVGMAVASNLAKNVVQQLLKDGVVHRGYVGIGIRDVVDPELAKKLGVEEKGGILVTEVKEGAPSSKAGVQEGDVITQLGGKPVKDGRDLQMTVASLPLGKPVDLTVVRDSKPVHLKVTIEEQPANFGKVSLPVPSRSPKREKGSTVSLDKIGLEVSDLTADLADQLGYKENVTGALITSVERDGLAFEAGLRRGFLITKVDKVPVKSATACRDAVEKGSLEQGILLSVTSPVGGSNLVLLKTSSEK